MIQIVGDDLGTCSKRRAARALQICQGRAQGRRTKCAKALSQLRGSASSKATGAVMTDDMEQARVCALGRLLTVSSAPHFGVLPGETD